MRVRIEGSALPGRGCSPSDAGASYDNIHVGVQRQREAIELISGGAESATWSFEVPIRVGDDGTPDFGGPFVHGRRGNRFVYLSWGTVDGAGVFSMFRRAKLHFADVDTATLRAAIGRTGTLVAQLGLTDRCGDPICARVRPPEVTWSCSL